MHVNGLSRPSRISRFFLAFLPAASGTPMPHSMKNHKINKKASYIRHRLKTVWTQSPCIIRNIKGKTLPAIKIKTSLLFYSFSYSPFLTRRVHRMGPEYIFRTVPMGSLLRLAGKIHAISVISSLLLTFLMFLCNGLFLFWARNNTSYRRCFFFRYMRINCCAATLKITAG